MTTTTLARRAFLSTCALLLSVTAARAQSKTEPCMPVDNVSYSFHADLAARATDVTPAGIDARARYHLPVATQEQVHQEVAPPLCAKAIAAIRDARPDGQAPERVYLFQVKNVYVVAAIPGRPFTGMVWTYDARMRTLLGGVLQ